MIPSSTPPLRLGRHGPRWGAWLVLGVLGISGAVRLFGIGWGIPAYDPALLPRSPYRHSYHLDEYKYLWPLAGLRPGTGDFDIKDYHWGSLQFYLIDGVLEAGAAVGLVPQPWSTAFVRGDAAALPRIYVLGRGVSVAAGVLATLIVMGLGTLLGGRGAGRAAGAAYALAPLAVVEADYLTGDVTMSALVAGAVLAMLWAARRGQGRWLVGAGLLLGLATATKYSAIFAAPALLVAQWAVWRASRPPPKIGVALVVLPWLAVGGGFLLGEPYALLAPDEVRQGLALAAAGNGPDSAWGLRAALAMLRWQGYYLAGLGLTWPLAGLAGGGVVLLLATLIGRGGRVLRRKGLALPENGAGAAILLAAIGGLVVGLAINRVFMLRYTQPLVPLLAVTAGVGWAAIPRPAWRMAVGGLALGVAGWITLGQVALLAGPHPANDLLAWLNGRLRPGQQVAQLWPVYPVLDADRYRLIRLDPWQPDLPPDTYPDYIILDDMQLGPASARLTRLLAQEYQPVARFGARPHLGPFAWDEGVTPHDWKYSHPSFVVYARIGAGSRER